MLAAIVSIISIGLSLLTYWGVGLFNQSYWFLFLLIAFFLAYAIIILNIYWIVIIATSSRYKGDKEHYRVNRFFLYNVRLILSFVLALRNIYLKKINYHSPKEPSLVLFNHITDYDPWALYRLTKGRYTFVGKASLRKVSVIGALSTAIGTLYVDRKDRESSYKMVDEAVKYITEKKTSVFIAPEGTRSFTGEIHPFKHGGFNIATRSHCPIILVGFKGMEKAVNKPMLKRCKVTVEIFKTIQYEEYKDMTAGELAEYCEKEYKKYLGQL